ncbi:MAG TPA: helix-turn-helix domain-containing protein [Spirochaetota bacterium]|nr:helix-turn-helix domain-containing protein [Spirochaetota bacterium]
MTTTAIKTLHKTWPAVSEFLSVPHDDAAYQRLVDLMDSLIDEIGNNEKHPAAGLMETIGVLIAEYEKEHFPIESTTGIEALKYLMEEKGIKQSDLKEIGSQGVVSEILNGKRALNVRQIKQLAERFNVSSTVFIK